MGQLGQRLGRRRGNQQQIGRLTQLYVAGEPGNAEDFLYRRIPVEQRERVTAAFTPAAESDAPLRATVVVSIGQFA